MSQIWIVDFGSQYTQLITRRCRELGFSSEIITFQELKKRKHKPKALVLSGGPQSIFEDKNDYSVFFQDEKLPILGICYGMQLMGHHFGGVVEKGEIGEYGQAEISLKSSVDLPKSTQAWMSHSDHLSKLPDNFNLLFESKNGLVAGIIHESKPIMGLQFHPEVNHTQRGSDILNFFFLNIAKLSKDWNHQSMIESSLKETKKIIDKNVLCAFSGGVDSLVAATMVAPYLKERLHCIFVDHGLLRPQDRHHIELLQKETNLNIEIVEAQEYFYNKLKGAVDPEEKRKIIGHSFIEVFEKSVKDFEEKKGIQFDYLLQGTLYPDVIESVSPHGDDGPSVTIKSHHNVGGLPERMKLQLLEPLRFLFKDEVRAIGKELGLEREWVYRHPFPGPGMGVRVLGELKPEFVKANQQADQILFEELKREKLYDSTWQALTVFLPVKTVGVKGDGRAYEHVICLRMVNSEDGMTATWTKSPYEFLDKVSRRICNEVEGITRVVYDITSKPPGTIEWE